jgi:hypothetical protein
VARPEIVMQAGQTASRDVAFVSSFYSIMYSHVPATPYTLGLRLTIFARLADG